MRAVEWFTARGVTVGRALLDNDGGYRSHLWRDTCTELGITHKRTRLLPSADQRQDRTASPAPLADGWAYARCYTSEAE